MYVLVPKKRVQNSTDGVRFLEKFIPLLWVRFVEGIRAIIMHDWAALGRGENAETAAQRTTKNPCRRPPFPAEAPGEG